MCKKMFVKIYWGKHTPYILCKDFFNEEDRVNWQQKYSHLEGRYTWVPELQKEWSIFSPSQQHFHTIVPKFVYEYLNKVLYKLSW